ncbi:MAG: helix-turn-helix transcriptional regulator [Bacteroidota bacterium]|nr:helix-turn-helix transcriptional regulator [Bacteroidota bacterium]
MHVGRNISKLRDLKGLKQEEFAKLLNMTQQAMSRLENKKEIDEDMLNQIAEKLGMTADGIRQFSSDATINSINQQGGNVYVERVFVNDIEKIEELYSKIIKEKDEMIQFLKKENEVLKAAKKK